jgi:hypothetical protein
MAVVEEHVKIVATVVKMVQETMMLLEEAVVTIAVMTVDATTVGEIADTSKYDFCLDAGVSAMMNLFGCDGFI